MPPGFADESLGPIMVCQHCFMMNTQSHGLCTLTPCEINLLTNQILIGHLEPWVTMISHVISHNCDITCDIELHHVI